MELRKLAAILFTDIQGFSTLLREKELHVLEYLQQCYYPLADQLLIQYDGRLIRREGDAIVAEFASPQKAVHYAESLQKKLYQFPKKTEITYLVRIGIHAGEVVYQHGEVLGHTLSVAKRLESFCQAGGICISQEVMQHLNLSDFQLYFQDQGRCALKGIGQIHVYQGYLKPIVDGFLQTVFPFLVHQIQNQGVLFCVGPFLQALDWEKKIISYLEPKASDVHEAAQIYEEEHQRSALQKTLESFFSKQSLSLGEELFFKLPLDWVCTTTIGGAFHQKLFERKQLSEEMQNVYLFFGSLFEQDFLITEDDLDELFQRLHRLPVELSGALATRTLVFLGCDPESRSFKNFYRRMSDTILLEAGKKRFLVWEETSSSEKWWSNKGVQLLRSSALSFVQMIVQLLENQEKISTENVILPVKSKRPYKFLDYFEMDDQAIFFGRENDLPKILAKIYSQNLLLLYAKSGSGKTSLINAGLRPELEKEGYFTCYIRVFEDPVVAIKRAVNLALPAPIEEADDLMLWAFLRKASRSVQKPFVLFLDQFEEFFIRLGQGTQTHFIHECELCLKKGETQTRFVFSMREDFLAELELFRIQVPSIFFQSYRLKGLQREEARNAIIQPAKLLNITWESELVDLLLQDLDEGAIEPPHLQIVCDRLYDKREGNEIKWIHYEKSGGAKKLLADYMTSVLEAMQDKKDAEKILKTLVTSLETKSLLSVEEILNRADVIDPQQAKKIMQHLIDQRLLRSFEHEGKPYCELAHDFLAIQIRGWLNEEEFKAKEIHDILRQELNNWNNFQWIPDFPKLEVFHAQRENPHLRLSLKELELILRSCLKHQHFFEYWWEHVLTQNQFSWDHLPSLYSKTLQQECLYAMEIAQRFAHQEARQFILNQLQTSEVLIREKAIELLTQLKEEKALDAVLLLLADPFPSVRWRALRYLLSISHPKAQQAVASYQPEEMIFVEAGPFLMGSEINPEERPLRTLELPDYYIDRYPVRNKDYALFVQATKRPSPKHWIQGKYPEGEAEHPVVHVSGHDAKAYAEWAGKRLPTEAEWEKAARGTDGRKYPWGDEMEVSRLNCLESGLGKTLPVGSYSPQGNSPYGVVDMAGQVWEWTSCWFEAYEGNTYESQYYGKQVLAIRGGSWSSQVSLCRTSYRGMGHPDYPFAHGGFRCVMDIPKK